MLTNRSEGGCSAHIESYKFGDNLQVDHTKHGIVVFGMWVSLWPASVSCLDLASSFLLRPDVEGRIDVKIGR